jgi:hypothetical protein
MKKTRNTYRSARTGKYVSKEYAEKHPVTTVKENDKRKLVPGPLIRWIARTFFRQY